MGEGGKEGREVRKREGSRERGGRARERYQQNGKEEWMERERLREKERREEKKRQIRKEILA